MGRILLKMDGISAPDRYRSREVKRSEDLIHWICRFIRHSAGF